MLKTEGLPKSQRLFKKKAIMALFEKGKGFSFYPFRVIINVTKPDNQCDALPRILVSVSKKRFHHAIKRNRIKRLIRETWRKNKHELLCKCMDENITIDIALVYTATIIMEYKDIEKKIKLLIKRLQNECL